MKKLQEISRLPPLTAIVAMSENRVIGNHNQLLWHLPADLKHFKAITMGHPILMGRKTYESIGRPLPHRTNIVLTRDRTYQAPGCVLATSIEEAVSGITGELFIIGGAQIYQQLWPHLQRIYLTLVHHTFEGDAYFPEIGEADWKETSRETHSADEANAYAYTFLTLDRSHSIIKFLV